MRLGSEDYIIKYVNFLRTPSIISEVIEQLVLFTIYRRLRILRYDLNIESQRISMCSQLMFLVSLIFFINYAHILSRSSLVGGNDDSIIFQMNEVSKSPQIGFFKLPINVDNMEVGLFYDNFHITLVYWNNNLFSKWFFSSHF